MSLENFWVHFPMSLGMFHLRSAVDSPRLDKERIDAILADSDSWLTHGSVKGYDPSDFEFLAEREQTELASGVEKYRPVNIKALNSGNVTQEEIVQAKAGLRQILEVIRPDKYADIDAFILGKKIENLVRDRLPDWVREMVFETGFDASGGPALWIWIEVEDQAARGVDMFENFLMIRQELTEAGGQICPDRWVYVRMRTVSEQRPKTEGKSKARSNKR